MSVGISLGWNCQAAVFGVSAGIRKTKQQGYNTCVFDEMVSNYPGIIKCIEDDFSAFTDPAYLELRQIGAETMIYNTKYNFWFNHESPGHCDLYIKQAWPNGINHYVMNNFQFFIERYNRRIINFFTYLSSGQHVKFILHRYNTFTVNDIPLLHYAIAKRYPALSYEFVFQPDIDVPLIRVHLILMGFSDEDEEIKRLNQ